MAADVDLLGIWGLILSVVGIGLTCVIWHNQTKQSNEVEKMVKRLDEYAFQMRQRTESFRNRSLMVIHTRFLTTLDYIGNVSDRLAVRNDEDEKNRFAEKQHIALRLILDLTNKVQKEEMVFLIPNITGDQREKIEQALTAITDFINYGKGTKIKASEWQQIANTTAKKILFAANSISSDTYSFATSAIDEIAHNLVTRIESSKGE